MIRGKYLTSKDDIAPVLAVRNAVFVEEQGFREEFDEADQRAAHLLGTNRSVS